MNIVDIYAIDRLNPRGRRIYRGFVSRYEPYIDASGNEGVRVTCLGLVSLLTFSYYNTGGTFAVTQTAANPEAIFKAIIDQVNTTYGISLLSYPGTTSPVGASVDYTF